MRRLSLSCDCDERGGQPKRLIEPMKTAASLRVKEFTVAPHLTVWWTDREGVNCWMAELQQPSLEDKPLGRNTWTGANPGWRVERSFTGEILDGQPYSLPSS